ncbi:hypothetical protein BC828DRAFT_407591 [Blastocladiella britannica]|nr:hypothetical protein BC828DRAFT_407591 [Blastocladiella britannica]
MDMDGNDLDVLLVVTTTAETKWAIEFNHAAADIFALNFPQATVAEADANAFLRAMVDPSTACKNLPAGFDASQLPKRGDVGMLYCGCHDP